MSRRVVLYACDTMADLEYAHITTVLAFARAGGDDRYELHVASADGEPVRTLGGLHLTPDGSLADLDTDSVAVLILPGGHTWTTGEHTAVLALARALIDRGTPVAGICGATAAMARAGLLVHHAHTVDEETAPATYPGHSARVHSVAVLDHPVVTALGEAPLEFARELFRVLEIGTEDEIDAWYATFKDVPDARPAARD